MALTAFVGCHSHDETVTDGEKESQKIEQTDAEEETEGVFVRETDNGYYVENYDYDLATSTITFHN